MINTLIHGLVVFSIISISLLIYDQQHAYGLFSEVTIVEDPDPDIHEWFGRDLSISGDVLVVSAAAYPIEEGGPTGAIYIYERNHGGTNNWGLVDFKINPDPDSGWRFAESVSAFGNTVVSTSLPGRHGQVHVYEKNSDNGNWDLVQTLMPPDPQVATTSFGRDVSISEDVIVVGEPSNFEFVAGEVGVVRIFEQNPNDSDSWSLVQSVVPNENDYINFGHVVFVSGDVFAASTLHSDETMSVYVFERNQNNTWIQVDRLRLPVMPNTASPIGISISGDTLVISNQYDSSEQENKGAVYVYEKNHNTNNWDFVTMLIAGDDHEPKRQFGLDVSIFNDVIAVGTPYNRGNQLIGAVYIFEKDDDNWNRTEVLTSSQLPTTAATFGQFLSMADGHLAVAQIVPQSQKGTPDTPTNIYIFEAEPEPMQCEPTICPDTKYPWELMMTLITIIILLLIIIGILILLRRK